MIGNSPTSDIWPALEAGLGAVLVPHPHTWVLEKRELPTGADRFVIVDSIPQLLGRFWAASPPPPAGARERRGDPLGAVGAVVRRQGAGHARRARLPAARPPLFPRGAGAVPARAAAGAGPSHRAVSRTDGAGQGRPASSQARGPTEDASASRR